MQNSQNRETSSATKGPWQERSQNDRVGAAEREGGGGEEEKGGRGGARRERKREWGGGKREDKEDEEVGRRDLVGKGRREEGR